MYLYCLPKYPRASPQIKSLSTLCSRSSFKSDINQTHNNYLIKELTLFSSVKRSTVISSTEYFQNIFVHFFDIFPYLFYYSETKFKIYWSFILQPLWIVIFTYFIMFYFLNVIVVIRSLIKYSTIEYNCKKDGLLTKSFLIACVFSFSDKYSIK